MEKEKMEIIKNSNILVVGAGGIGCELLKNLVMWNFRKITIVDLDTIDVSNLNRQFLFRKCHVGKSKALTAKHAVTKFTHDDDVQIEALCTDIMKDNFDVDFYKQFNVVLNALDNKTARNHVNRKCLQANVPLIEGGTMGYRGQVQVIMKNKTSCYECYPKPAQKQYPACTIRNTPSEPIHCVIWAKFLFNQLFGEVDSDEDVIPDLNDPELAESNNVQNGNHVNNQDETTKLNIRSAWRSEDNYDINMLMRLLFQDNIQSLLSMDALWTKEERKKPVLLSTDLINVDANEAHHYISSVTCGVKDQENFNLKQWCEIFKFSVEKLIEKQKEAYVLTWDKDDCDAMDFVAAVTNIRMYLFHIQPMLTRFIIKSMAGNIIPAIASTNAIIAGISVLQAYKVITGCANECRDVMVADFVSARGKIIQAAEPLPPVKDCYVCSNANNLRIYVKKLSEVTLCALRKFFISKVGFSAPNISLFDKPVVLIDGGEDEEDIDQNQYNKMLTDFINNMTVLRCSDYLNDDDVIYNITIVEDKEKSDSIWMSEEDIELMKEIAIKKSKEKKAEEEEELRNKLKRQREDGDNEGPTAKKVHLIVDDDDDDEMIINKSRDEVPVNKKNHLIGDDNVVRKNVTAIDVDDDIMEINGE